MEYGTPLITTVNGTMTINLGSSEYEVNASCCMYDVEMIVGHVRSVCGDDAAAETREIIHSYMDFLANEKNQKNNLQKDNLD